MLKIGGGKVAPFFLFNFVGVLSNSSYIPYAGNFLINIRRTLSLLRSDCAAGSFVVLVVAARSERNIPNS